MTMGVTSSLLFPPPTEDELREWKEYRDKGGTLNIYTWLSKGKPNPVATGYSKASWETDEEYAARMMTTGGGTLSEEQAEILRAEAFARGEVAPVGDGGVGEEVGEEGVRTAIESEGGWDFLVYYYPDGTTAREMLGRTEGAGEAGEITDYQQALLDWEREQWEWKQQQAGIPTPMTEYQKWLTTQAGISEPMSEWQKWQTGYLQQQQQLEQQQYLANLAAEPHSWLEYSLASGQPPVVQPWMLPLQRNEYPSLEGLQVGQPIPGWPQTGTQPPQTGYGVPQTGGGTTPTGGATGGGAYIPPTDYGVPQTGAGTPTQFADVSGTPWGESQEWKTSREALKDYTKGYLGAPTGSMEQALAFIAYKIASMDSLRIQNLTVGDTEAAAKQQAAMDKWKSLYAAAEAGGVTASQLEAAFRYETGTPYTGRGAIPAPLPTPAPAPTAAPTVPPPVSAPTPPPPVPKPAPTPAPLEDEADWWLRSMQYGGWVTEPTVAKLGEKEPELVTPLSQLQGQFQGAQGGLPLSGMPSLLRPSRQYQARMGPTAFKQFLGYRQARTGIRPEEQQWRLWNMAPPGGGYRGLSYTR